MSRRTPAPARLDADVVVIGGSVVGLTLSSLLLKAGFRVAVVEASEQQPAFTADNDLDLRVFAITRASESILQHAGAWSTIRATRLGHFRDMHVWDSEGRGVIDFHARDLSEPTLGYIVENRLIQSALEQAVSEQAALRWYRPASLERIEVDSDRATVFLEDGQSISCHLVAGADGAFSRVRDLCGIACEGRDYEQSALVCHVRTERPHGEVARQRFLPGGPLAFLPLSDPYRCSIVWSCDPAQAMVLKDMDESAFREELGEAFQTRLGTILESSPRVVFPLNRAHAGHYVQHRVALLGDAAHRIHPLAGQGANLGLLDAASLAEVLVKAGAGQCGSLRVLRRYERWRRGDNLAMMLSMDAFKDLFASPLTPLRWIRNNGMSLLNQSGFAKTQIMRRAMGLDGDLPAVARQYYPSEQL